MDEFEYDNEYDAEEFSHDDDQPIKKPPPKKETKNTYVKKRDTDNLYEHEDLEEFDNDKFDMEDLDDIPVKDTKKNTKVDKLNTRVETKLPKIDDKKPKVEEKKSTVIEKKPSIDDSKAKVNDKKQGYPLPGQISGKDEDLEDEEELETFEVKPISNPRRDKAKKIDTEPELFDAHSLKTNKKESPRPNYKEKYDDYEDYEEDDQPIKEEKIEIKEKEIEKPKSLVDTKPFEVKKKPPSQPNPKEENFVVQAQNRSNDDQSKGGVIDKLKDQNIKLKNELKALAKAADEALQRERQNRLQKRPKETEDSELRDKMAELREQLTKIDQMKHQIAIMKRQLENTYNLPKVIEKEDALRAAQKELNRVLEEKNSLMKIKKEQHKALDFLNNEGEYEKKLKQVTEELRKAKEEQRKQNDLFLDNDKTMKRLHERIIVLEEKCKDLQKKIKEKKSEKQGSGDNEEITEEMLQGLENRLKELQEKKSGLDKTFDDEIKGLEKKKKTIAHENSKLSAYLKEKEKEIRLNNLRLKELRKLTKLTGKPLPGGDANTSLRKNSLSEGGRTPSVGREGSSRQSDRRGSRDENKPTSVGAIKSDKGWSRIEKSDNLKSKRTNEDEYGEEDFEEEIVDDKSSRNKTPVLKGKIDDIDTEIKEDDGGEKQGVFSKPSFMKKKK